MGIETALIGGGAAVGGALIGARASRKAAETQANAADRATAATLEQYYQTREDFAPWRAAGGRALTTLEGELPGLTRPFMMSDFEADPGYQFRLSQGEQALARRASSIGRLRAPATDKALLRFSQGLASDEYGNAFNRFRLQQGDRFNRLAGVAGIGQTATQQLANVGQSAAANAGNFMLQGGNAAAAGIMGQANAIAGGIGAGVNQYTQMRLIDALQGGRGYNQYATYGGQNLAQDDYSAGYY